MASPSPDKTKSPSSLRKEQHQLKMHELGGSSKAFANSRGSLQPPGAGSSGKITLRMHPNASNYQNGADYQAGQDLDAIRE